MTVYRIQAQCAGIGHLGIDLTTGIELPEQEIDVSDSARILDSVGEGFVIEVDVRAGPDGQMERGEVLQRGLQLVDGYLSILSACYKTRLKILEGGVTVEEVEPNSEVPSGGRSL